MRDIRFVNAYAVSRQYGGPEEGGWWYDAGEPLASVPAITDEEVEAAKKMLTERLGWESKHNRYSVLGGDDFEVCVQSHVAKHFPETRPHYE